MKVAAQLALKWGDDPGFSRWTEYNHVLQRGRGRYYHRRKQRCNVAGCEKGGGAMRRETVTLFG